MLKVMSLKSFKTLSVSSNLFAKNYNPNIYDDVDGDAFANAEEGLRYFRAYAKRGIEKFCNGDLNGSLVDFDRASRANSSQPLVQRGISLYCGGQYQAAADQLLRDVNILEDAKLFKASDIRIWLSAAYNKLGHKDLAIKALDHTHLTSTGLIEQRYIINCTLSFFAGETSLDDMLTVIGSSDEKDMMGFRFYGNFYLGLYYDSVNEFDLAKAFLSFPRESVRYPTRDMWYHVPRALYKARGFDDSAF